VSHPLSDRKVGSRDISHGLDAFGILGELSLLPDLFEFGGGFRFVTHRMPQIRGRGSSCLSLKPYHALDRQSRIFKRYPSGMRRFRAESAIVVKIG
jgi:hypothetical protein